MELVISVMRIRRHVQQKTRTGTAPGHCHIALHVVLYNTLFENERERFSRVSLAARLRRLH
jgi:hypothetical protein